MLKWDDKDPDEVDSFGINWAPRLNGDLIASSTWTVDGLTQDSSSNTTTTTTVWLSGGVDGDDYEVQNRITTTGGRTIDQTVKLRVRSK
jgi:hypothetical protein